jgi:hypothetical protein
LQYNLYFPDGVKPMIKVVVWYKLSIKSDTTLIVTPEQYVDRDDNTTGNKKKDETEHLPIKNIYIYEIYHKSI